MLYLLLSILSNLGILFVFKVAGKRNIHTVAMVTVNYISATLLGGFVYISTNSMSVVSFDFGLISASILIGFAFMLMFLLVQLSSNKAGLAITSAAAKLSVVFPVFASLLIDPLDFFSWEKGLGFLLVVLSLIFIVCNKDLKRSTRKDFLLPVFLFAGMGFVDVVVKVTQQFVIQTANIPVFTVLVFCMSGLLGFGILIFKGEFKYLLKPKPILFGVMLGVCNYGSLFFFIKNTKFKYGTIRIF